MEVDGFDSCFDHPCCDCWPEMRTDIILLLAEVKRLGLMRDAIWREYVGVLLDGAAGRRRGETAEENCCGSAANNPRDGRACTGTKGHKGPHFAPDAGGTMTIWMEKPEAITPRTKA